VNGVQNEKGLAKSKEFLGFSGTDCEAIIDLGKEETVSNVIVHTLRQTGSWIWRPMTTEVFVSTDGTNFTTAGLTDDFNITQPGLEKGNMKIELESRKARFVKLVVKNWGEIPAGEPGAGNKAWLFVDEVEIN
jgi:hexosaminidase